VKDVVERQRIAPTPDLKNGNEQPVVSVTRGVVSLIDRMFDSDVGVVRWAEPYFAVLGKRIRMVATATVALWIRMVLGDGPVEKVFAIVLGYTVVALFLGVYLNILTTSNVRGAGRAIRSTVRQQVLIAKVNRLSFDIVDCVNLNLASP
jgi:hypothetical protein